MRVATSSNVEPPISLVASICLASIYPRPEAPLAHPAYVSGVFKELLVRFALMDSP